MSLRADQVHRWIAGFEAIEQADRERLRREGPHPEWSIPVALELIEAARASRSRSRILDSRREAEDEAVRQVWERLRSGLLP